MGTREEELWEYFSQYGRVNKVTIVKPKNLYAIIEFSTPDTVTYILSIPSHRLNSSTLIVKKRELNIPGQPATNKYQQEYQQFQAGGNLGRGAEGRGPGPPRPGGAKQSLMELAHGTQSNETWFDNAQAGTSKKVTVDDEVDKYYHEELMEKLANVKGVQNQLEWLCQNLQVTAEEAQTKFTLCELLQNKLAQYFPGCTVNQFGSSVNGFGLTGCDMDIFLDLTTMTQQWTPQPVKLPYLRDLKFISNKEFGPFTPKDMERLSLGDQCKLVSRILVDNLDSLKDVNVVPSKRTPTVRFKNATGEIKCDLSMNNKMALQNTKLLYLYSVLNSRVRLLVYAIRYWGKVKGIAGASNATGNRLTNYTLTLLVLCYLQNVEPQVLPTIEQLSLLHGPSNRTRIEGWDTTFAMDWQIIPQTSNNQSTAELLAGFFSYWSAFDFSENVLITRTATSMPITEFLDKDNMKDGRIRNFKFGAMNIQDPFCLDHNISQNIIEKMREKIMRELRIAAIKTSVWHNEGFSMESQGASLGGDMLHLLSGELPDIIKQEDAEKLAATIENGKIKNLKEGEAYVFEVEMDPKTLGSKTLKILQKEANYRVNWCRKTCNFILRILKDVCILSVEELPDLTPEEKLKKEKDEERKAETERLNEGIKKRNEDKKERRIKAKSEYRQKRLQEMREKMQGNKGNKRALEEGEESAGKKSKVEMEEISDDEELIEFIPEAPPLRFKSPSTADVNFQYFMRSWCRTWARRKKVKQYLNREGHNEEGIAMEKLISEAIFQNDGAPLPEPVVGFYCTMESEINEKDTKVRVAMEPTEGFKEFGCFFQFHKMYLYRMIEKHFTASGKVPTVGGDN